MNRIIVALHFTPHLTAITISKKEILLAPGSAANDFFDGLFQLVLVKSGPHRTATRDRKIQRVPMSIKDSVRNAGVGVYAFINAHLQAA
jgi:hypothetical protein